MTVNESIKAVKDYLRMSNVSLDEFNEIVFQDDEALLNGKLLFNFYYDNGGMDLMTLDYDNICSLNMNSLAELFPSLHSQVYCSNCKHGNHSECEHENVIYSL